MAFHVQAQPKSNDSKDFFSRLKANRKLAKKGHNAVLFSTASARYSTGRVQKERERERERRERERREGERASRCFGHLTTIFEINQEVLRNT